MLALYQFAKKKSKGCKNNITDLKILEIIFTIFPNQSDADLCVISRYFNTIATSLPSTI